MGRSQILSQIDKMSAEIDRTLNPTPELDDILQYATLAANYWREGIEVRLDPDDDLEWQLWEPATGAWSPYHWSDPDFPVSSLLQNHISFPDIYTSDMLSKQDRRWLVQTQMQGQNPKDVIDRLMAQSEVPF